VRGLDTNVLLRALTGDDPVQSPLASSLLAEAEANGEQFHVSTTVLCELVWALRGGAYRQGRDVIVQALEALLASTVFALQHRDLVRRALDDYREGPGDFADYLIGWQDDAAGCAGALTFDRRLEGCDRFSMISGK
jgi:predicted nucleic-acid-binding protein